MKKPHTDRDGDLSTGLPRELELQLEQHRPALTAYCYRMLGSSFEAEDAVQDAFLRAWRGFDSYEGRASIKSWLYRIATNVCIDMLAARKRRMRPMELGPSSPAAEAQLGAPLPETTFVEPIPEGRVFGAAGAAADPAEQLAMRQSVRLAFVAALQLLPPRQRAVLILREVLHWSAAEVAELLDTSVASVNSALQRARATLDETQPAASDVYQPTSDSQRALLGRYVDAFERWDLDSLVALLHEDATLSMPPFSLWLQSPGEILQFWLGPGSACRGSRLIPVVASGLPAFAQYKPGSDPHVLEPWAIHLLEIQGDRIVGHNSFLDTARLFPLFGLPPRLDQARPVPAAGP